MSKSLSDDRVAEALERYADQYAAMRAALTKIRDLAKAGRLDEIFTLANRALTQNPQ